MTALLLQVAALHVSFHGVGRNASLIAMKLCYAKVSLHQGLFEYHERPYKHSHIE